jgi:pantoate kinase
MRMARAYSPAGLSGLFSTHTEPEDPYRKGARGAGIALSKGAWVTVEVEESDRQSLECYLNGARAELGLVRRLLRRILPRSGIDRSFKVVVRQEVDVPVGGGLGTSGACALATALALAKALDARMSYYELAREAHVAEIEEGTGLGTISGLVAGGIVMVLEPGAPGYDRVDRVLADPGLLVVVGFFGPIDKREALSRADLRVVDRLGLEALARLEREPTVEAFIRECKWFAERSGYMSGRVKAGVEAAERAGALGASQAMIGETVFALVYEEYAERVREALEALGAQALISRIEWGPARLV